MRRFTNFFRRRFWQSNRLSFPIRTTSMWLYDVGWMYSNQMPSDDASLTLDTFQTQPIHVSWYLSEADLRTQWRSLDTIPERGPVCGANLTIILALSDLLSSSLSEIIGRKLPGHRLVIVPLPGHWPGIDSFGDLAIGSRSLGWNSIEIRRNLGDALESTFSACENDERRLVLLPCSIMEGTPQRDDQRPQHCSRILTE